MFNIVFTETGGVISSFPPAVNAYFNAKKDKNQSFFTLMRVVFDYFPEVLIYLAVSCSTLMFFCRDLP